MRRVVFPLLIVALVGSLFGCQPAVENTPLPAPDAQESRVLPGQRLGAVVLGEGVEEVRARLGSPVHTGPAAHGLPTLRDVWEEAEGQYLVVYYQEERVVQIEANGPHYATAEGISSTSTYAEIERHYAPFLALANPYEPTLIYHDAVDRGISFGLTATGEGSETVLRVAVIQVHEPGREVLLY